MFAPSPYLSLPRPKARSLVTFRAAGVVQEVNPVLFTDLRSGVLPVNDIARFIIAAQEGMAVTETLEQLLPAMTELPQYQQFAVLGPILQEAVSLRDILVDWLAKRLERRPGHSNLVSPETWDRLQELDQFFGRKESPVRLLRDKVYAHRHPVLSSTKSTRPAERTALFLLLFEARHQVLSPEAIEAIKKLQETADDICLQLLPHSTWGRCEESMLTELYAPVVKSREEFERDVLEFEEFFCLRVDPEILSRVQIISMGVRKLP